MFLNKLAPTQKAPLQPSDLVLAVDSTSFLNLTHTQACDVLKNSQERISMTLLRFPATFASSSHRKDIHFDLEKTGRVGLLVFVACGHNSDGSV